MMNSTEKSLPEKLSDDIIAYILEEQLQPNDKLPNESVSLKNGSRTKLHPKP